MTTNDERGAARPSEPAHGQVVYLQVPAIDVTQSAICYERNFGWHIERPYPGFAAPGLIGQWVSDRPAAPDAGQMAWIQVDRIDDTLYLLRTNGDAVLEPPSPDGPLRWLATISIPQET